MASTIKGASRVRLAMQLGVAAAVAWWLLFWFFVTINSTDDWLQTISKHTHSRFLNIWGATFLLQVVPIIVIAFLSYFLLELRRRLTKPSAKVRAEGKTRRITRSLWTFPIFVRRPIGMVTLGDLAFLLIISFIILWFFIKLAVKYCYEIDTEAPEPGDPPRYVLKLVDIGVLCGSTALIPMALLWIPVSRGSPILQVIGVPFEHAVRYHTWLGYITLYLLIAHGVLVTFFYIHEHEAHELIVWYSEGDGVSVPPGIVALAAGVIMMLTAVGIVRRRFFDLFYISHQLYWVFLIFFFFHAVGCVPYLIVPVIIFFLDRFIRLVQSRKTVEVLSAKVHKSGIIELKFAKPTHMTYHALSFVYLMFPSVSKIQWHPFSVASSPYDNTNVIIIFIKPLGGFTKELHDSLISSKSSKPGRDFYKCPFSCKVGVEGPYGDESAFYLRYNNLVMVAGGIGVTPFLAILQDILHRYKLRQEDLPSFVELILCVRNASELHILDSFNPSSIMPDYAEHLKITINAYVTSAASAPDNAITTIDEEATDSYDPIVEFSYKSSKGSSGEISPITSSGHPIWVAAALCSTIAGFFIINGIFNVTALEGWNYTNYVRVFLYLASFTIAVLVFGGAVLLLWFLTEKRARKTSQVLSQLSPAPSLAPSPFHDTGNDIDLESTISPTNQSLWADNVLRGRRPVWKDVFSELAAKHKGDDLGVLVSGACHMLQDVARECRRYSLSPSSSVVMHYHSVSFEL